MESLERARADLEMLLAAYPDEVKVSGYNEQVQEISAFPIRFELRLFLPHSEDNNVSSDLGAVITMEMNEGYPVERGIEISSYRILSTTRVSKKTLESAVQSIRDSASEALDIGEEGALVCCMAAQQSWSDCIEEEILINYEKAATDEEQRHAASAHIMEAADNIHWIAGKEGYGIITDRKSTFQAFVCTVYNEEMVSRALQNLISSSNKIQKATHNMFAYRFKETIGNTTVLKHDNDDDGEHGAGSRLAQLLAMREDDGVLIVVSRWFGGIHLGPKRFSHIINVARELLEFVNENNLLQKGER